MIEAWTDIGSFLLENPDSATSTRLFKLRAPQFAVAERLEAFYQGAEKVLENDSVFRESVLLRLASLNISRRHLCAQVDAIELASASLDGRVVLRNTLRSDILTLQRQCAALQASVKNFKGDRPRGA